MRIPLVILYCFASLLAFRLSNAFAQNIKVLKVKNRQAIINFQEAELVEGEKYQLLTKDEYEKLQNYKKKELDKSEDDSQVLVGEKNVDEKQKHKVETHELEYSENFSLRRKYLFNFNFVISNYTNKTETSGSVTSLISNDLEWTGNWGWNFKTVEIGPLLSYQTQSSSDSTALLAYRLGGFFDINFVENIPDHSFIYGLSTQLSWYSSSSKTNGGSTNILDFGPRLFVGGDIKYFLPKTNIALRWDFGYSSEWLTRKMTSTLVGSTEITSKISIFGYQSLLGLSCYY